jgi:hypothetical protein
MAEGETWEAAAARWERRARKAESENERLRLRAESWEREAKLNAEGMRILAEALRGATWLTEEQQQYRDAALRQALEEEEE